MDAREYDRIADLLMQIRAKLSNITLKTDSIDSIDNGMKARSIQYIDQLLFIVDTLGKWDEKGWL